jgi:hypothetical protein
MLPAPTVPRLPEQRNLCLSITLRLSNISYPLNEFQPTKLEKTEHLLRNKQACFQLLRHKKTEGIFGFFMGF